MTKINKSHILLCLVIASAPAVVVYKSLVADEGGRIKIVNNTGGNATINGQIAPAGNSELTLSGNAFTVKASDKSKTEQTDTQTIALDKQVTMITVDAQSKKIIVNYTTKPALRTLPVQSGTMKALSGSSSSSSH